MNYYFEMIRASTVICNGRLESNGDGWEDIISLGSDV